MTKYIFEVTLKVLGFTGIVIANGNEWEVSHKTTKWQPNAIVTGWLSNGYGCDVC